MTALFTLRTRPHGRGEPRVGGRSDDKVTPGDSRGKGGWGWWGAGSRQGVGFWQRRAWGSNEEAVIKGAPRSVGWLDFEEGTAQREVPGHCFSERRPGTVYKEEHWGRGEALNWSGEKGAQRLCVPCLGCSPKGGDWKAILRDLTEGDGASFLFIFNLGTLPSFGDGVPCRWRVGTVLAAPAAPRIAGWLPEADHW